MAGVYLFLVKEMKILLVDAENALSYVLVVVRHWLKEAERLIDGNKQPIIDRLNHFFYPLFTIFPNFEITLPYIIDSHFAIG